MPNHVRQQIREAVATAVTGLTTTGARVYQSRVRPLSDADLPCLLVSSDDETVQRESFDADCILRRELVVSIRAAAKATSALDDTLDTIIKEVETALAATAIGGADGLTLASVQIEMDDSLEKPVGMANLRYAVTYFTAAGSPTTAL